MEIRIRFSTNLDAYSDRVWPKRFQIIPHVGEYVEVSPHFIEKFQKEGLPYSLQVVRIVHYEREEYQLIDVKLHLSEIQQQIYGKKLFGE